MAGDWIKMRGNLWDDPRISRICDLTDQPEAMVVGGLYWLWSSADQHTEDGIMPGLTLRGIDRKTGIQGFGDALVAVGWLADHPEGVRIVNFEEHNGESAKRRCADAKRKANSRTQSGDVPDVVRKSSDKPRTENGQVRTDAGAREREEKEKSNTNTVVLVESAAKPRPSRKCPTDFDLTPEMAEWCATQTPLVDPVASTAKFRDHTFKTAITDWPGAWRNWMRRDQEFTETRRSTRTNGDKYAGAAAAIFDGATHV